MKIIIPMAGMGKRMRPHTLTIPKPLIPVAGKPMVQWLVEDITRVCSEQVTEIAYVVGRFGEEAENKLLKVAESLGAKGTIHYQDEPLGTAHAVLCARTALDGKVIIAFADTLFKADFKLDESKEGIIWVQKVDNPSSFGVVKLNSDNIITDFIEKPKEFISDLAIIGIYYFQNGKNLRDELQYLIDNDIKGHNEYQLTDALENMKKKGLKFVTGQVEEWLDCGNKDATVYTNQRMLEIHKNKFSVPASARLENAVINQPCFIGENTVIKNSIVGPYVSLGDNSAVENSVIKNSIVQKNTSLLHIIASDSMIGQHAVCKGKPAELSIGDYNILHT